MKVGKPKSKRTPVRLRHKIQKASASKERKRRKDAKKNPEWRSRLKKDPGIPNLFPYKAQVLAEIEEGKRKKQEEAQRRREIAKAQRQGRSVEFGEQNGSKDEQDDDDEVLSDELEDLDEDEVMDEQDDSNPMAALLASAQARAHTFTQDNDDDEDGVELDDDEEWNGVAETNPAIATAQLQHKGLPKQALSDPIKSISKLLERVQDATGGLQILLDHYQIPPLVTAGGDLSSRFLVEVARKRGRLGKGGVPNLRSAALTVLGDLNDQRLVLPAMEKKASVQTEKGEVKIVQRMAEPFRIEGLWGDQEDGSAMIVETELTEKG